MLRAEGLVQRKKDSSALRQNYLAACRGGKHPGDKTKKREKPHLSSKAYPFSSPDAPETIHTMGSVTSMTPGLVQHCGTQDRIICPSLRRLQPSM